MKTCTQLIVSSFNVCALVISSSKKLFSAMDLHTQTFYSLVDQRFHGDYPLGKPTNEMLDDLHKEYSPSSFVEGK